LSPDLHQKIWEMGAIIASLHLPSSMVRTASRVIAVVADHSGLLSSLPSSPRIRKHHLMDHVSSDEDRKAEMRGRLLENLCRHCRPWSLSNDGRGWKHCQTFQDKSLSATQQRKKEVRGWWKLGTTSSIRISSPEVQFRSCADDVVGHSFV